MFRYIHALLVSFLLCGLGALAYGQDTQVQGQVSDPTAAAISKALVRVVDQRTGTERKTETNDNGQYTVPGLASGSYMIYVQAPGFGAAVSNQIVLNPGQSAVLDFTLKVGGTSADVVVTAEKREESIQDTPVPVSVLQPDALSDSGQVLLRDYYTSAPGLNVLPDVNGIQSISIRGITTGVATSTVAFMVDEVPYGASTDLNELPDIDPGDLARIEVLRGPQGTLYGDSSMGGLMNYVTKSPTFDGFSGRFEGGTDFVSNGSEPGYNLRTSANLPLNNHLAIRVSGFERQDPGYVDNPTLSLKGVNRAEAYGGRLSALWLLSQDTSVALSALGQYTKADGVPYVVPSLGGSQQNYIAGTGGEKRAVEAYSAKINTRLGGIALTSLTGYNVDMYENSIDFTEDFGGAAQSVYGPAATGAPFISHFRTKKLTQELRLSGTVWNKMDWLAGGFYTHEHSPGYEFAQASNALTGRVIGNLGTLEEHGNFEEYAGFANITYHFNDRFDIQVGGRETNVTVSYPENVYTGIFASVNAATSTTANTFTYLVTPKFELAHNMMSYARFASGFRPGSANTPYVISLGAPAAQAPDHTYNYEAGLKADFYDRKLSIDGSLYYINWQNIQINLAEGLFTYGANGGTAKSEGVDFSATVRPLTGLSVGGWIAYDDAVLTQSFPTTSTALGLVGDRLPFAPRLSSNISVEQQFPVRNGWNGFVGAQIGYLGERIGTFEPTEQRQRYPAYTKTDLRAGIRHKSWTTSVFANNIADSLGQLNGGIGAFIPNGGFIYITPRIVGVNLLKTF